MLVREASTEREDNERSTKGHVTDVLIRLDKIDRRLAGEMRHFNAGYQSKRAKK